MRTRVGAALALAAAFLAAPRGAEAAASSSKGWIDNRLSAMSYFHPVTGQANTISVWAGVTYAYSPIPEFLWIVVGGGYVAAGPKPGSGRGAFGVNAGLEFAYPVVEEFSVFARALGGLDVPLKSSSSVYMEQFTFSGHVGARFGFAEIFGAAGLGPAANLNIGFGVALSAGF
jgi:hypothetical protein